MKEIETAPAQCGPQKAKNTEDNTATPASPIAEERNRNTSSDEAELRRLGGLSELEYARQRKEAAASLGISQTFLDKAVNQKRRAIENTDDNPETWEVRDGIQAWCAPVDGHQLAADIRETFNRYCILPTGGDVALTLWTLGTYCYDAFSIFPKILLSSPVKRCGKSTVMDALASVVSRALPTSNTSAAAIFRAIQEWAPSLLIDEADTFLNNRNNDDMVGIINSGHRKSMAFVLRVVGDDHQPKRFSTWAPMAIAMIKEPPDTVTDRSITITLRRKLVTERVIRLPVNIHDKNLPLRRRCLRWAQDRRSSLTRAEPEIPRVGNDRAEDNWLPLLAIADILGGDWPSEARQAMVQLESKKEAALDDGTMLLTDIRTVFEEGGQTRLWTQELIAALAAIEDKPWCDWRGGKPISTHNLARLLKPYGVKPKQIKKGYQNRRGFELTDFDDAFARYLPVNYPESATSLPANNGESFQVAGCNSNPPQAPTVATAGGRNDAACSEVAINRQDTREDAISTATEAQGGT